MSRILVVDDNEENLYLLQALLQSEGHEVEESRDGADALSKARQSPPDLIISDLLMPTMDGYTLLRHWKSDERLKQVPFVVYTATYTEPEDERLALSLGADAFLIKPAEPDAFLAKIRDVLAIEERGELLAHRSAGDQNTQYKEYSEVLVRKLEEKALDLQVANRELAGERARLEAILDSEPECLKVLGADGSLREINRAGLAMLEADSFEQVANRCIYPLVAEEHRGAFRALTEAVFRGEAGVLTFEIVGLRGGRRWLETHAAPLRDEEGKVTSLLAITRDVTEAIQTRKALHESLERFELLARATHDAAWDWNIETDVVWWNDTFRDSFGYRIEDMNQGVDYWMDRIHPEDKERMWTGLRAALDGRGQGWTDECRYRRGDGSYAEVLNRGLVLRDEQGRAVRMVGAIQDVTERKMAERRIRQLNRTYAMLIAINQLIVREREPQVILDGACSVAVDQGGFLLAWVGLVDAPAGPMKLAAHAGASPDTRQLLERALVETEPRDSFAHQSLESGSHAVCNDIARDPQMAKWREQALQRGFRALASFPFTVAGRRIGALTLHAGEAGFFDVDELHLLDELASDISFALEVSQHEAERQRADEKVRGQLDELRRWQNVMLAREERIQQLKAEVNALLIQRDQPARYFGQGEE